jgi:hypothetical protein
MRAIVSKISAFNWFFLFYTILGFFWMFDYGVPLDELTQRHIGLENARYIWGTGNPSAVAENGFFGPVFEVITYVLEQLNYTSDLGFKICLRHFVLFSFFLLALRAFYAVAKYMETATGAALTATILFAFYPLLFAHAHYNSKDTFFLCLFLFALYFLVRYLSYGKFIFLVCAGIVVGIASTVRLNGLFILAAFVLSILLFHQMAFKKKSMHILGITCIFLAGFYIFYPYLWIDLRRSTTDLLQYITANPWPWKTMAAGKAIIPGQLPWWYLGAWMGVTIPVCTLILFGAGTVALFAKKGKNVSVVDGALLFALAIPVLYFLVFRPTIYNGWRHMQFLIVPVSLLTVYGFNWLARLNYARGLQILLIVYSGIIFIFWHPFGYAYFNEIYQASGKPGTYDQDYWGLSSLQAVRWVAENDHRDSILISSFTESPELNGLLLPEKQRKRLHFTRETFKGHYEIEMRREHAFGVANGEVVFIVCPLKDTLVRVVKIR